MEKNLLQSKGIERSKGHLMFFRTQFGTFELWKNDSGRMIYKSSTANPIQHDGRRAGRFEGNSVCEDLIIKHYQKVHAIAAQAMAAESAD